MSGDNVSRSKAHDPQNSPISPPLLRPSGKMNELVDFAQTDDHGRRWLAEVET